MAWYTAEVDAATLEAKFTEFVRLLGGEHVADLLPRGQARPLNADYLLWGRSVVAELKIITKDHYRDPEYGAKMLRLVKGWAHRGLIPPSSIRPSDRPGHHIISSAGLPLKEQRKAASLASAHLISPINKASRQIRETKRLLGLPKAKGLLILANVADASMSPKVVFDELQYVLGQHRNGTFESFVFIAPRADRRFHGNVPALWMSGTCADCEGVSSERLDEMAEAWHEFSVGKNARRVDSDPENLGDWPEPPSSGR